VVYVETLAGALYLDRPFEVDKYREAWKHLHAGARDPESSLRLVTILETGDFSDFRTPVHPGNW